MSPSDRVAQLYSQALCSLFIAFYDSQGYGESIRTRLHPGTNIDVNFKHFDFLHRVSAKDVKFSKQIPSFPVIIEFIILKTRNYWM
jgi:hypothetical protein